MLTTVCSICRKPEKNNPTISLNSGLICSSCVQESLRTMSMIPKILRSPVYKNIDKPTKSKPKLDAEPKPDPILKPRVTLNNAPINKVSKQHKTKPRHSITDYKNYDFDNYGGKRIWCIMRDNFKCTVCGTAGNLTVHHKDGFGCAYPPESRHNHLDNLQTVCDKCHKEIEPDTPLRVEDLVDARKCRPSMYVAESLL